MRRFSLWISSLLCFALASTAHAQAGLNLYWSGCSDGGTMLRTFACNTNTGSAFDLYASVILPADLPRFAASTTIIDINFIGTTVPAWWQVAAGQCRANAVSMSFDPNTFVTNCPDLWNGAVPLSVFATQYGIHGLANELRLNGGAAVAMGDEIALTADGTERVVARVVITRAKTTGAGSCAGCIVGACLGLKECFLQQPYPDPGYRLTNQASNAFAMWNGYTSPYCGGVWDAARNRTWGQVKSLYR